MKGSEKTRSARLYDRRHAIVHVELLKNAMQMALGRANRDRQPVRDLLIAEPATTTPQHFDFTCTQQCVLCHRSNGSRTRVAVMATPPPHAEWSTARELGSGALRPSEKIADSTQLTTLAASIAIGVYRKLRARLVKNRAAPTSCPCSRARAAASVRLRAGSFS